MRIIDIYVYIKRTEAEPSTLSLPCREGEKREPEVRPSTQSYFPSSENIWRQKN